MVDNFTYTLFRFGVKSIDSLWRLGYGAFFILLFIYLYRKLLDFETGGLVRFKINVFLYTAILLIGISGGGIALSYLSVDPNSNGDHRTISKNKKLPNILLLASDGLNADHMSVYGYLRDTTPFIKTFSKKALVFDNFLPSTGNSGGSIASILTGKLPTQIKVIYPPDILRGKDAYEHLPAILRKQG